MVSEIWFLEKTRRGVLTSARVRVVVIGRSLDLWKRNKEGLEREKDRVGWHGYTGPVAFYLTRLAIISTLSMLHNVNKRKEKFLSIPS